VGRAEKWLSAGVDQPALGVDRSDISTGFGGSTAKAVVGPLYEDPIVVVRLGRRFADLHCFGLDD
jgi:hypothetical protein